ncbi:MAG: hypothetical protein ABI567_12250 [Gammaproteobacteria bacterium]
MFVIDPAWAGKVQFYELLFGTWTVYLFLVLLWERVLRAPLPEWRYVMLNFMGAGAFWINHYFQYSPWGRDLLNLYAVLFLTVWWWLGVRRQPRSLAWKTGALFSGIVYTVAFIGFEQLARAGVERYGVNEFWFMAASFFGFIGVILWRGRQPAA